MGVKVKKIIKYTIILLLLYNNNTIYLYLLRVNTTTTTTKLILLLRLYNNTIKFCYILLFTTEWREREEPAYCRCASFVSSRHNEIMVLELPAVDVTSCDAHNQCKNRCTTEVSSLLAHVRLGQVKLGHVFLSSTVCHL